MTDLTTRDPSPLAALLSDPERLNSLNADTLERLYALHERAQADVARREYAAALAEFQAAMPPVGRTKGIPDKNRNIKFWYAPLEEIVRIASPHLRDAGLAYRFDTEAGQGGVTVTCWISHTGGHSEASHAFMPTPDIPQTSAAQKAGGAITFAKRTAFCNALGILTADDDRGGEETTADGVDAETVTEEQAANLAALVDETGSDLVKFLAYGRVEKLADWPARRYGEAVKMLERKRAQA